MAVAAAKNNLGALVAEEITLVALAQYRIGSYMRRADHHIARQP